MERVFLPWPLAVPWGIAFVATISMPYGFDVFWGERWVLMNLVGGLCALGFGLGVRRLIRVDVGQEGIRVGAGEMVEWNRIEDARWEEGRIVASTGGGSEMAVFKRIARRPKFVAAVKRFAPQDHPVRKCVENA